MKSPKAWGINAHIFQLANYIINEARPQKGLGIAMFFLVLKTLYLYFFKSIIIFYIVKTI